MTQTDISLLLSFLDTLPEPRIVMGRDYTIVGANHAFLAHYRVGENP